MKGHVCQNCEKSEAVHSLGKYWYCSKCLEVGAWSKRTKMKDFITYRWRDKLLTAVVIILIAAFFIVTSLIFQLISELVKQVK